MSTTPARRPTVRMSEDELWAFVTDGHSGILTTLRADGSPVALPIWYAVVDRKVYIHTRGKKLIRVGHNPVSSFLVEDGEKWAELRAVHLAGTARIVTPSDQLAAEIDEEISRKYDRFRTPAKDMPEKTRAAYSSGFAWIEFTPGDRILNWNNAHLTGA